MKNKKRVLLVALVITTLLAGCGESKQIVSNKNKVTTEKKEEDTSQDNTVGFSTKGTIEPTVMYEENDVKITAESLTYENNMVTLTTAIENNSEKSLSFSCETLGYSCNAVNGYMIENGWMSCDLEAGGKHLKKLAFLEKNYCYMV